MGADEIKGEYVGSGGFRVDRARMLERLSRYGHARSQYAVVGLVRSAVLGKASRVTIQGLRKDGFHFKTYDGLEISFDGEPFDRPALENPYDCLFADGPGRARKVELARALLTIIRLKPRELTVTSGPAGARLELSVESPSAESLRAVDGDGPTVVRAAWESLGGVSADILFDLASMAQERFRHSPIPVDLVDVWLGYGDQKTRHSFAMRPDGPAAALNATFERNGLRGRVEMPMRVVPSTGHVALYWAGAQVEFVRDAAFLPVPVDGFVDSAAFRLDLSAGAIVRDEAYDAGLAALAEEAGKLASTTAREQHAVMAEAAALLKSPASREVWTDTLNGRVSNEPEASWWDSKWSTEETLETRRTVFRAAVRTRWLRYCAQKSAESSAVRPELSRALMEAPLYFSTALQPLSLQRLGALSKSLGKIPASASLGAVGSALGPVLWLSSARDAALLPQGLAIRRIK